MCADGEEHMCDSGKTSTYDGIVITSLMLLEICGKHLKIRCQKSPIANLISSSAQIKYGHLKTDSGWTYGGYSASQTVHQKFIVKVFLKPFLETFLCI